MAKFVDEKKNEELNNIIREENLDKDETYRFIYNSFRNGYVQTTGTEISKVLPPASRFTATGERAKKKETVLENWQHSSKGSGISHQASLIVNLLLVTFFS